MNSRSPWLPFSSVSYCTRASENVPGTERPARLSLLLTQSPEGGLAVENTVEFGLSRNVLPLSFAGPKYTPVPAYRTRFETLGKERHLPSGERWASRAGLTPVASWPVRSEGVVIRPSLGGMQWRDAITRMARVRSAQVIYFQ